MLARSVLRICALSMEHPYLFPQSVSISGDLLVSINRMCAPICSLFFHLFQFRKYHTWLVSPSTQASMPCWGRRRPRTCYGACCAPERALRLHKEHIEAQQQQAKQRQQQEQQLESQQQEEVLMAAEQVQAFEQQGSEQAGSGSEPGHGSQSSPEDVATDPEFLLLTKGRYTRGMHAAPCKRATASAATAAAGVSKARESKAGSCLAPGWCRVAQLLLHEGEEGSGDSADSVTSTQEGNEQQQNSSEQHVHVAAATVQWQEEAQILVDAPPETVTPTRAARSCPRMPEDLLTPQPRLRLQPGLPALHHKGTTDANGSATAAAAAKTGAEAMTPLPNKSRRPRTGPACDLCTLGGGSAVKHLSFQGVVNVDEGCGRAGGSESEQDEDRWAGWKEGEGKGDAGSGAASEVQCRGKDGQGSKCMCTVDGRIRLVGGGGVGDRFEGGLEGGSFNDASADEIAAAVVGGGGCGGMLGGVGADVDVGLQHSQVFSASLALPPPSAGTEASAASPLLSPPRAAAATAAASAADGESSDGEKHAEGGAEAGGAPVAKRVKVEGSACDPVHSECLQPSPLGAAPAPAPAVSAARRPTKAVKWESVGQEQSLVQARQKQQQQQQLGQQQTDHVARIMSTAKHSAQESTPRPDAGQGMGPLNGVSSTGKRGRPSKASVAAAAAAAAAGTAAAANLANNSTMPFACALDILGLPCDPSDSAQEDTTPGVSCARLSAHTCVYACFRELRECECNLGSDELLSWPMLTNHAKSCMQNCNFYVS